MLFCSPVLGHISVTYMLPSSQEHNVLLEMSMTAIVKGQSGVLCQCKMVSM